VGETGLDVKRNYSSQYIAWDEVKYVTSDEHRFFLYLHDQSAIIIPKDVVESKSDFMKCLPSEVDTSVLAYSVNVKRKRMRPKLIFFSISILIILMVVQHFYHNPENDVAVATQKVSDLFVAEEGPQKVKSSTSQD